MSFGQASGPPASFRQLEELTALLHDAGHRDFRDARGPMGFTQRQSAGKFTRDEAEAFIARLRLEEPDRTDAPGAPDTVVEPAGPSTGDSGPRPTYRRSGGTARSLSSDQMAAELRRRGWTVQGPPAGTWRDRS